MNLNIKSILIVLCVLITCNSYAVSFTADAVQIRETETSHAKMFWHDGNIRFEYTDQGVPMVQILDSQNNRLIWLDSDKKVYVQRELTEQQARSVSTKAVKKYNPCDEFVDAECTHLKATELNDRLTDKWLVTLNIDGRDRHVFQWVDIQYQILVRQENPDGSVLDVKIQDNQEINGRKARKVDMLAIAPDGSSVHGIQWYDSELDIIVRQQADDGAIDELRNIRIEQLEAALFTVPGDFNAVESQLTDLNTEPAITFGATSE